jgi:hypothetical protein
MTILASLCILLILILAGAFFFVLFYGLRLIKDLLNRIQAPTFTDYTKTADVREKVIENRVPVLCDGMGEITPLIPNKR